MRPALMRPESVYDLWLVDTEPYRGMFGAPEALPRGYDGWLLERFEANRFNDGRQELSFGIRQRLQAILFSLKRGGRAVAFGPHAVDAATVIEYLSDWTVTVEAR